MSTLDRANRKQVFWFARLGESPQVFFRSPLGLSAGCCVPIGDSGKRQCDVEPVLKQSTPALRSHASVCRSLMEASRRFSSRVLQDQALLVAATESCRHVRFSSRILQRIPTSLVQVGIAMALGYQDRAPAPLGEGVVTTTSHPTSRFNPMPRDRLPLLNNASLGHPVHHGMQQRQRMRQQWSSIQPDGHLSARRIFEQELPVQDAPIPPSALQTTGGSTDINTSGKKRRRKSERAVE
jgi:hypothetical protein